YSGVRVGIETPLRPTDSTNSRQNAFQCSPVNVAVLPALLGDLTHCLHSSEWHLLPTPSCFSLRGDLIVFSRTQSVVRPLLNFLLHPPKDLQKSDRPLKSESLTNS